MGLSIRRNWVPLEAATVNAVPAQVGVYEISNADGKVLIVCCAGGRALFGLRWEATSTYLSRRDELLMLHLGQSGSFPPDNPPRPGLRHLGVLAK